VECLDGTVKEVGGEVVGEEPGESHGLIKRVKGKYTVLARSMQASMTHFVK
jgi:uncharacterized protein YjbJ (UPF0337 family)